MNFKDQTAQRSPQHIGIAMVLGGGNPGQKKSLTAIRHRKVQAQNSTNENRI